MNTIVPVSLALLVIGTALCKEPMTPEQFRRLAATEGDSVPLRAELRPLPVWKASQCSITMSYQDGKVVKEECAQSSKTIQGQYIVFTVDSKVYKRPMSAIVGYDETASAIRTWALFGNTLIQSTMVFDPEKKISASTSTYPEGFMEISVGSHTEKESSERCLVYKNGVLFMTREMKSWPIAEPEKGEERDAPQDGDKSSR
jgi:hypothetical protein